MSTVEALIAEESTAWDELSRRLEALPSRAWTRPGVNGEWTPKDLLAHVAFWHAEGARMLSAYRATGAVPGWVDTDATNAQAYGRWKDEPLEAVRAEASRAHEEFLSAARSLAGPLPEKAENAFVWNAQRHYRDHFADLDRFAAELVS